MVINLTKLLTHCEIGTKLYSPICGECELSDTYDVSNDSQKAIEVRYKVRGSVFEYKCYFDSLGRLYLQDLNVAKGECVLFPSEYMRDWSKLTWKKGDVLIGVDGLAQVIFEEFADDKYLNFNGKYLYRVNGEIQENVTIAVLHYQKTDSKEHIEFVEKKLGGKLNLDTLEIEKTPSEFKDGDILWVRYNGNCGISEHVFIYRKTNGEYKKRSTTCYSYLDCATGLTSISRYPLVRPEDLISIRNATDEEKQLLFDALSKEGYCWDADKKQVVKMLMPGKCYFFEMENELSYIAKMKRAEEGNITFDGNVSWCPRANGKYDYEDGEFTVLENDCYNLREATDKETKFFMNAQKDSKKAQIKFKPLDYVLARFNGSEEWVLCQYSHTDKDGCFIFVGGNYTDKEVIPYSGNEELLGTTKSICDGE